MMKERGKEGEKRREKEEKGEKRRGKGEKERKKQSGEELWKNMIIKRGGGIYFPPICTVLGGKYIPLLLNSEDIKLDKKSGRKMEHLERS